MKPYYEHNGIVIYHADARDVIWPELIGECDVMVTDPPYGIDGARGGNRKRGKGLYSPSGQWEDTPEYVEGVIVPTVVMYLNRVRRAALTPGTIALPSLLAYRKPDDVGGFFMPTSSSYGAWGPITLTVILYYGKDPRAGHNSMPSGRTLNEAAPKIDHPCPKPMKAWEWLVQKASLPGETVIDPFMGSGTTLLAAKHLGRQAIGIEIEERYCELAAQRLSQEAFDMDGAEADERQE